MINWHPATRNLRPSDTIIHHLIFSESLLCTQGWVGVFSSQGPHRAFPLAGYHWARVGSCWLGSARHGTAVFPLQPVTSSVGWSHHNKGRAQVPWRLVCPLCPWTHVLLFYIEHLFFEIYTLVGIIIIWLILLTFIKTVSNSRKSWRWSDLSHKSVYYWKGTKQLEPNTKLQQLRYITITSREFIKKKWRL